MATLLHQEIPSLHPPSPNLLFCFCLSSLHSFSDKNMLSPPPPLLLFNSIVLIRAFNQLPISHSLPLQQQQQQQPILVPNKCNDQCGHLQIPFPFHLNSSCGGLSHYEAFHLSCLNSTTLYLKIGSQNFRVFEFFSDGGVLVDSSGTDSCRRYFEMDSFDFGKNGFYGISIDNVLSLYDCDDSSVCKMPCEKIWVKGCEGNASSSSSSYSSTCCYPLSDRSVWKIGDGFSVFSNFGCRGFSSWVSSGDSKTGKRGVKLEWAVPRKSSKEVCAANAFVLNATTIENGVRCKCQNGFIGDGFKDGDGCLKSCIKKGHEEHGNNCYTQKHKKKKPLILAGLCASVFFFASLAVLVAMLRRPIKSGTWDPDPENHQNTSSLSKASRTRLFTYEELEAATKGFHDTQKLVDGSNGAIHAGILGDGSHVAVQTVHCKCENELMQVLSRVEILSTVSHRHVAFLLGGCIYSDRTPLVVYEFSAHGTLAEHLHHGADRKTGLDWFQRLNIAAETAIALAYLEHEISPSIYHHDLKSGNIFLDEEFSIKLGGFGLLNSTIKEVGPSFRQNSEGTHFHKSDVYDFGVVLLEILSGSKHIDLPTIALAKIRSRKLEEVVDPLLSYHEQLPFRREQMGVVADIAARCLLFGADGRLSIMDVARELFQITKETLDGSSRRGPALEETFSNSSLLQMISMSPDSSFVH